VGRPGEAGDIATGLGETGTTGLGVVGFTGDSGRVKGDCAKCVWGCGSGRVKCGWGWDWGEDEEAIPGSARFPTMLGAPPAPVCGVGENLCPPTGGLTPIGVRSAHRSFALETLFPLGSGCGFGVKTGAALRTGEGGSAVDAAFGLCCDFSAGSSLAWGDLVGDGGRIDGWDAAGRSRLKGDGERLP
jgi:hypothetical protein